MMVLLGYLAMCLVLAVIVGLIIEFVFWED